MSEISFGACFSTITPEHAIGSIIKNNITKLFKKEKFDRIYYIFIDKDSEMMYNALCITQEGNPFIEVNIVKFLKSELTRSSITRFLEIYERQDDIFYALHSITNINIRSKVIPDLKYPTIKKESEIISTKFMSDKKYTINNLFGQIMDISNIDQLLIRIKMCLVYIIIEGKWYCWTGTSIKKTNKEVKNWNTGILGTRGPFTGVPVKLGWVLDDMMQKFELFISKYDDLGKFLVSQPSPITEEKIGVPLKDVFLTHRFIKYKMDIAHSQRIRTGPSLYEEYELWKKRELATTLDKEFRSELLTDPVKSSTLFTITFKKKDEISPGDEYYLDKLANNNLIICKIES